MNRPDRRLAPGFTMVELIIALAIMMLAALIGLPALQRTIVRTQIEGGVEQVAMLVRQARLESIKRGAPAVVVLDTAARTVTAFIDLNDAAGNPVPDLIYNPQPALDPGKTDYLIQPPLQLTRQIILGGPAGDSAAIVGLTDHGQGQRLVLNSDGSTPAVGSFRMGDGALNFYSVSVQPAASAKVQILKWNSSDSAWDSNDMRSGQALWQWYTP